MCMATLPGMIYLSGKTLLSLVKSLSSGRNPNDQYENPVEVICLYMGALPQLAGRAVQKRACPCLRGSLRRRRGPAGQAQPGSTYPKGTPSPPGRALSSVPRIPK